MLKVRRRSYPAWFIFLFLPFVLSAQALPTHNLGTLVHYGRVIFTAKPLAEELQVLNTPEGLLCYTG